MRSNMSPGVPPACVTIAELPYSDVNCANALPVINQLVAAQAMNATSGGITTRETSTTTREMHHRSGRSGLRRCMETTATTTAAAAVPRPRRSG